MPSKRTVRVSGRGDAACYTRTDDERARLAPVTRSLAAIAENSKHVHLFLPLGDRLGVDAVALGQHPQALLTMLYRSTDRLCRGGAPVKNLSHSASFHCWLNNAPSNAGTKQLGAIFHRIEMSADAPP